MGRRDNSKAQRQIACMGCAARDIEKKFGHTLGDTATLHGLALGEVYGTAKVFEGLCPTHRNTYRLTRDAIDKQADAESNTKHAFDEAIAKAAAEGRMKS